MRFTGLLQRADPALSVVVLPGKTWTRETDYAGSREPGRVGDLCLVRWWGNYARCLNASRRQTGTPCVSIFSLGGWEQRIPYHETGPAWTSRKLKSISSDRNALARSIAATQILSLDK
jgi:hypothetical protein